MAGDVRNWPDETYVMKSLETKSKIERCEMSVRQSLMDTSQLEVGMRFIFTYAYAVAVYADLYPHIRMTWHRKIHIMSAVMRISANICGFPQIYADKPHNGKCIS